MSYITLDSLAICWEHLSPYYVACILLSFSAIIMTWWYIEHGTNSLNRIKPNTSKEEVPAESKGVLMDMKVARQAVIDQQLSKGLSEEQLQQEKETEKEQLAAIYDLLCKQAEKFNVNSMEELQGQMKLYRR